MVAACDCGAPADVECDAACSHGGELQELETCVHCDALLYSCECSGCPWCGGPHQESACWLWRRAHYWEGLMRLVDQGYNDCRSLCRNWPASYARRAKGGFDPSNDLPF